jgi:hypothetical protein
MERERQVVEALSHGASSIDALRLAIYPDLDPRLSRAADGQLLAHLLKLEHERRVVRDAGNFRLLEGS